MPSRYEAMSYAMLEAAAAGKPLIMTDVGGARTVVEDGVNGRIVRNSDDPQELSDAMLEFGDEARARSFALAAFAREDRFRLETMAKETLALYGALCGIDADEIRRSEKDVCEGTTTPSRQATAAFRTRHNSA
jgi:glycosyltransferase involved in cell wall biosynthesis